MLFVCSWFLTCSEWSWIWVRAPLIVLTVIGVASSVGQAAKKKELKGSLGENIQSLRDIIESEKARRKDKH